MLRRVIVEGSTHVVIHATDIDGGRKGRVLINFSSHSFDYLRKIIKKGMRLNLLNCTQLTPNSMVFPAQIIVEPDFLIDISSIAACFKEYGHHPLNYTINRLGKNETSQPILLGNYAGAALDALLYGKDCSFAQVLTSCFCQQPLEYLTCTGFNAERFKSDAIVQAQNIKEIIDDLKGKYDLSNAILEPSFVCETLGIQGRVDMMTTDFKLLIEQKSGKNFNLATSQLTDIGYHIESHYVQLLLYFAVLYHNFSIKTDATDFYLLYSKYRMPTGLLPVNNYEILVEEAIKLRNQIVATELLIAEKGFPTIRKHLRSDVVNTRNSHSKLFTNYQKPQLDDLLSDIKDNDNHLLIKYFDAMATFVYREQRASWLGDSNEQTTAVSYLWKMTLEEKLESGNIFLNLRIKSLDENGLFARLECKRDDGFLPNFRRGDSVFFYEYKDTPDVRSSFLHKANILKITSNEIFIKFLNPLNTALFPISSEDEDGRSYAIEHSSTNVSTSYSIRSLSAFLKSDTRKQQLLLGQRTPESDKTMMLSRQYSPDYDEIILGVKQARDYYLLIGPPGTGKTSMALRFIVQEELATLDNTNSGSSALLLLSYTNRAVDEICEMLYGAGIDFIRIGNEHTADEQWQQNLLSVKARSLGRLSALKQELLSAKVVVATTSTISSRLYLFSMKHFSTVIVDEASQILEPNIIGILSQNIGKFVLIGDYKQLPAVVQQSAEESLINDATLKDICLTDCRNSLFERLINIERKAGRTLFTGILRKQGRMHPEIADFVNKYFYKEEALIPVPLEHQTETQPYPNIPENVGETWIDRHRMIFIDVKKSDEESNLKANTNEAKVAAWIVQEVKKRYADRFNARKTVGIIVPYRNHISTVRQELEKTGVPEFMDISVDTVERYQGSQRDVIIYSFTICHPSQLSFLSANTFYENGRAIDRKFNVAITRARRQFIALGNKEIVGINDVFAAFLDHSNVKVVNLQPNGIHKN